MDNKCLSEINPFFSGVTYGSILEPLFVVIFFSYIVLKLNQSKIIKYDADETVKLFEDKDYDKVEKALWFVENELLLNLKPG